MKKELFLAVLAGGVLGLIIAFGIWRANSAFSPKENGKTEATETPVPSPSGLTIAKPQENEVVTESTITVSGITKPNSTVALSAEDKDYIVIADAAGGFETIVDLIPGLNQLVVTAFDAESVASTANLKVVYSSEFVKATNAPSPTPAAETETSSGEAAVRAKVEQKFQAASKLARAYIGTVTDISERTLQIKTASGEIIQAQAQETAGVVKLGTPVKTLKFGDIAIGDFVLALGYKNGNAVLDTSRILITSPAAETARKAIIGQFGSLSVTVDKNTKITKMTGTRLSTIKLSAVDEKDTVVAIGAPDAKAAETLVARRLHIVTLTPQ